MLLEPSQLSSGGWEDGSARGCSVPLQGAEAGMCARRRTFFLLRRQKKEGKEKATPSLRPPSPCRAMGAACDARAWGGVAELAAFFELRSNIRDELEHEVRVSFGTRTHPSPCASRRSQQGWGAGSKTAAASQLRRVSGRAARCRRKWRDRSAQAKRSEGATGRAKQWPVWSPLPPPSDRAEKRRAWGERVPKDTRIVV